MSWSMPWLRDATRFFPRINKAPSRSFLCSLMVPFSLRLTSYSRDQNREPRTRRAIHGGGINKISCQSSVVCDCE